LESDITSVELSLKKTPERWTYPQLAAHLVNNSGKKEVAAPVCRKGFFVTVLPVAIQEIKKYSPPTMTPKNFTCAIFSWMLDVADIHFVPWHKPLTSGRSHPYAVSAYDWMFIDQTGPLIGSGKSQSSPETQMMEMTDEAADSDPSAPWSIPDHLQDMGPLWNKIVLSNDWDLKHASLDSLQDRVDANYVCKTYNHVAEHYNGHDWKQHLGLVWAILFSCILPEVFWPCEMKGVVLIGSPWTDKHGMEINHHLSVLSFLSFVIRTKGNHCCHLHSSWIGNWNYIRCDDGCQV
jgi:hypothetical protein